LWSRKALLNLDYVVEYIAADNPTAAAEIAQRIWDASQLLADQPGMGRPGRVADIGSTSNILATYLKVGIQTVCYKKLIQFSRKDEKR
jgi:plasmid stabilization system protein ParE